MIYVGIDVASKKHDCYIMSDSDFKSGKLITINNDMDGFTSLKDCIDQTVKDLNDSNVRIGLESTGHYSHNILHYLVKEGFDTMLINPLLTNMERKSSSVRKTKTDTIDAKSICMFLSRNQEFKPYTIKSYHSTALKSLSRSRISLVKQLAKKKQELHMLVTVAFPEYLKVFSTFHGKTSLELLHKYSVPSVIAKTRIDGLTNTVKNASKGHRGHGNTTAAMIKDLAKTSAGDPNPILAIQIKICVETIRFLQQHIKTYETEIKKIMDEHCPIILTIPGISYVTGAIIIGEIGEISLFNSPDKLTAFAGLDPCVYQSGQYNSNSISISKRGSSYLRWAIHQSASIIVRYDDTFAAFYAKKRAEGKHHLVALGHVSKKLIRIIFHILKYDTAYVVQN